MSRYSRERRGPYHPGQDEVQTSIPPTTSSQPPRPVSRPHGLSEEQVQVAWLEESVIVAWKLWRGEITQDDPSYDYLLENLSEVVEEIFQKRPDYR